MDSKEFPISGTAGPPGPKVEVILQKEQMNHDTSIVVQVVHAI